MTKPTTPTPTTTTRRLRRRRNLDVTSSCASVRRRGVAAAWGCAGKAAETVLALLVGEQGSMFVFRRWVHGLANIALPGAFALELIRIRIRSTAVTDRSDYARFSHRRV